MSEAENGIAPVAKPLRRHVLLLGDVLLDAYAGIDKSPGKFEDAILPRSRTPWKLTVIPWAELEQTSPSLPADATHAMLFIEGNHAIEQSGLLDGQGDIQAMVERLSLAADEFERKFERMIQVAQAARLLIMACTMFPPNHRNPQRQRAAYAALAIFNDRITKRAAEAKAALIDLRLTCNESGDYDKPTLLSRSGVQKIANVVRFAMYELDAGARRCEVFF
jgi:hypothetical protein